MTLNPSADLKALLPQVLAVLKQVAQDPDSVDLDMGQAQQVKDALSNLMNAKQQGKQGQKASKNPSGSTTENDDDDEKENDKPSDDDEEKETQKKSRIIP